MANVFINGAGGFIGTNLVEHFVAAGHQVTACGREGTDLSIAEKVGATIVRADITDVDALKKAMKDHEVVINVVGIFDMRASNELLEKVNHVGVINICEAIKDINVKRLVQLSTVAVYGPLTTVPAKEDADKRPNNGYGRTKWAGERVAFEAGKKYGFEVTAVRPTLVYGPRGHYGHADYLAISAILANEKKKGLPMVATGPLVQNVHIADVCGAVETIAFHKDAAGEAFNIVDDEPLTVAEFMGEIYSAYGLTPSFKIPYIPRLWSIMMAGLVKVLPQSVPFLERRIAGQWNKVVKKNGLKPMLKPRLDKDFLHFIMGDLIFDNSKIKGLGYKLKHPSYKKGLAETVKWYRQEKWLP